MRFHRISHIQLLKIVSGINRTKQGQALISEAYLSARQLIVLELEFVLELGANPAVIQASTETLTHRKPNNVAFVQEPKFSATERSSSRTIFKIYRRQSQQETRTKFPSSFA